MSDSSCLKPNALAAYTVVVLSHEKRYLLLRRAETKRFAPGMWTGVGGLVESSEFTDLQAAALRELFEETGIVVNDISNLVLRRVLLHARPKSPLTLLLYFTGLLGSPSTLPECTEGTLAWISRDQLAELKFIENAQLVIPLLISDLERDLTGEEQLQLGVAHYNPDNTMERIVWV